MEDNQCKNPHGEEGRKKLEEMVEHHRDLTIWGLALIPRGSAKEILDIGCGGGLSLKFMALKYPNAKCHGIDISETSVECAKDYNKFNIQWGKVDVQVASVEDIPFPEESIDIITAVETYFFWPDIEANIAHAASRLRKGGVMCIISEQYYTDTNREEMDAACAKHGMHLLENDEMVKVMEKAGMKAEYTLDPDKGWVTYIGIKE